MTVALKGQLFTSSMKAKMQDYMAAARAGQERGMEAVGAAVIEPEAVRIVAAGKAFTHLITLSWSALTLWHVGSVVGPTPMISTPPASLFCPTPHPLKYMAPPPCQPVGSCGTRTVQRRGQPSAPGTT